MKKFVWPNPPLLIAEKEKTMSNEVVATDYGPMKVSGKSWEGISSQVADLRKRFPPDEGESKTSYGKRMRDMAIRLSPAVIAVGVQSLQEGLALGGTVKARSVWKDGIERKRIVEVTLPDVRSALERAEARVAYLRGKQG